MLTALFAAALLQQGLPQDPTEKYQRRITPEVEVVALCKPAVVYIRTEGTVQGSDIFGRVFRQQFNGAGSGVMVKKQGFVITNYHVVEHARQITVSFAPDVDEQDYPAQLISFVAEEDLALLKIQADKEFPTIAMGTSADLMLGERVIAIGNPYGQTHTVSQGIISGLHRNVPIASQGLRFDDLIQTDASINPGNSGGPLLNINGELIGINNCMNTAAQNIGFAIPVDKVKSVLQSRLTSPDAARTWLGFEVENMQISRVTDGSPAEKAGLKPGDCIVALAGQTVRNNEDYRLARIALPVKEDVELRYERAGKTRSVTLTPWDASDGMIFQRLGLRCDEVRMGYDKAVLIREVREGSPAAALHLEPGDVFNAVRVLVAPRPRTFNIRSREDLAEVLNEHARPGTQMEVEIFRDLNRDGRFSRRDELHRGTLTVR